MPTKPAAAPPPPAPPKLRGLAALLPESVLRGAQAAIAEQRAGEQRRALPAPPAPKPARKSLPASRPIATIGVVASPAGVLVGARGRLPTIDKVPGGGFALIMTLPSGRSGGLACATGVAPKGLRWARLSELTAADRADALALAPDLLDLERLASAEAAAREALDAAGVAPEDLAGLRVDEVLRLAAERLRRLAPTIRGVAWS